VREAVGSRLEPPAGAVDRILTHVASHAAIRAAVPPAPAKSRAPRVYGVAAGLLALAASLSLWLGTSARPAVLPASGETAASAPHRAAPRESAVIEAVDFGAGGGTIFVVESEGGHTPVVWLRDASDDASQHPL
jgi:hypothetical protein